MKQIEAVRDESDRDDRAKAQRASNDAAIRKHRGRDHRGRSQRCQRQPAAIPKRRCLVAVHDERNHDDETRTAENLDHHARAPARRQPSPLQQQPEGCPDEQRLRAGVGPVVHA
jgi:hypothetical protein